MIAITVQLPGQVETVEILRLFPSTPPSGMDADTVSTYRVTHGERQIEFTHRYGDGWEKCVAKAFTQLAVDEFEFRG